MASSTMPSRRSIQRRRVPAKLIVRALNAAAPRGRLQFGPFCVPCALGHGGIKVLKREGDGATPRGRFRLRGAYLRPDAAARPRTALEVRAIRKSDGWCDSRYDRNYTRPVTLPYARGCERLWREDRIYDIIVVLGYNDRPRVKNRGSAIFMHIAKLGLLPTEGCIALRANDLRRVLQFVSCRSEIVIQP
jgi:L,D-peptidoglycan transpeptidase YkuD (ErfK/YbiS/YcfS/YnhG family)